MTDERIAKAREGCPTCGGCGMDCCERCGYAPCEHGQQPCSECARVLAYGDWCREQVLNTAIDTPHTTEYWASALRAVVAAWREQKQRYPEIAKCAEVLLRAADALEQARADERRNVIDEVVALLETEIAALRDLAEMQPLPEITRYTLSCVQWMEKLPPQINALRHPTTKEPTP